MNLEVFAGELTQDHALDPLQVEQSVGEGGPKGFEQGRARIVVHQLEQAAQREGGTSRRAFFENLEVFADLREPFQKEFFFRGRVGARRGGAARVAMFRQAILAAGGLDHTRVRGDEARPAIDFNLVFGLAHFDVTSDEVGGGGIAIAVDRDEPFHIYQALVEEIDGRRPDRQRLQVRSFGGEQLARAGLEIVAETGIDLVAPLAGLLVGIGPVAEGAARQEVGLDVAEAALDSRRAVGVAYRMSLETEAVAVGEGGHLGHRHHVATRAFQHHQVSVVNQAGFTSPLKVLEGVGESLLANSPSEQVKSSLIATMSDTYKGNFALAAKLGQTVDAFRIVETARGRSLADLLRRPRPQEGEHSEGEKAARAEFNNLQRTLMGTSDRVQRGALLDKVFVAEQLMGAQAPPINAMQGATLQAHPVDLAKLRTVLLPDEVLLEYVLADPTSFCLVIDQKRAVIVSLPAGQKAIEEATDHYLNQVEAEKRDNTDARELYDVLLGPVRQLPRTARLTIVPDGTLWRLPIETLRGPDGKYILQSHTVSYAPSSTVLYYLRTLRRPLQPQMAFLGIGSVPYDLEPKDGGPSRGIMRAVSRGVYDVSGTHLSQVRRFGSYRIAIEGRFDAGFLTLCYAEPYLIFG